MIRTFFKENAVWYWSYALLSALFLIVFALYHLPIVYFVISFLLNLTILSFITLWQYQRFKHKINTLQQFIYVNELDTLQLPSELAYKDVIIRLYEQSAQELLAEQAKTEDVQSLVKMWSHQMKVPLSALSLMAQTNQLDGKEVQQQLTRLQNYLDTLLTYLKFSQNKDDFRFERLSVRNITIENVKKYRIPCLLKQLSIEVEGDWLLASDRKWLSFAISQILDNAIKYSKEQDKIRIEITDGRISISDNGIGILEEDLPRLFEEGFTGFNGHENQKATGLGLYMTKQILDSLNLAISITSQVDKGTQVTIALPKE